LDLTLDVVNYFYFAFCCWLCQDNYFESELTFVEVSLSSLCFFTVNVLCSSATVVVRRMDMNALVARVSYSWELKVLKH